MDAQKLGLPHWEYDLIEAFYDNASDSADALIADGAVDPHHAAEIPDYFARLPEDKTPYGRCLCRKPHPPRWELASAGVAMLWFRRHRVGFFPDILPAAA